MEVTITLPDTVTITAGDTELPFAWADLGDKLAAFVAQAACVGVAKAGNDAASGAKAYAEKNAAVPGMDVDMAREILIRKWIAARVETGTFERGAAGMSRVEAIAREQIRAALNASPTHKAAMKNADADGKAAMIEAAWDAQSDDAREALLSWARGELDRRNAEAAAKKARLAAVKVNVTL